MKFVISTQELNYLISKIQGVVGQKATIPILANVLIEALNDELILTATDLTVGVRCCTETKILEEGTTTLPIKKLASLVRELTTANVQISSDANEVTTIIAGTSRFKLHGMNKEEFPSLPDVAEAAQFSISQKELKEMFSRTAFAVSKEDNRYVLTGVFINISAGRATFVGTDGKRLARTFLPINIDPMFSGGYIVPLKAVEEIAKNLGEEGDAKVFLMKDKIAVEADQVLIVTKLLFGDYPDVDLVIPGHANTVLAIHRDELTSLLRQISLFTVDATKSVRFSFCEGELQLNANSIEVGEGKVSMPVNYHGAPLEIAFNPKFFLDILQHCKEETVTLGITDGFNPGIIIDKDAITAVPHAYSPLFVLMPMRFSEE